MAIRKYQTFGLRRDRNLSDVQNKEQALNNILNDLVSGDGTFISQDLDAIRNIRNTNVRRIDFEYLNDAVLTGLVQDEQGNINTVQLEPFLTIQDRINLLKSFTGSLNNGLTTIFFPSSTINSPNRGDTSDDLFDIRDLNGNFVSGVEGPYDWWGSPEGSFALDGAVFGTFSNSYGGIQWEGFIQQTASDDTINISYETTGLLQIETRDEGNNDLVILKSIYEPERSFDVSNTVSAGNRTIVTLAEDDIKYISIGDKFISYSEVANSDVIELATPVDVIAINGSDVLLDTSFSLSNLDLINVKHTTGSSLQSIEGTVSIPNKSFGEYAFIRISWWFDLDSLTERMTLTLRNEEGEQIPRSQIIEEIPNYGQYYYRNQIDETLNPVINDFGDSNKIFRVNQLTLSKYTPQSSISDITTGSDVTSSINEFSTTSSLSASRPDIEYGNYAIESYPHTNLPKYTQVRRVLSDTSVELAFPANTSPQTSSTTLRFVDHKGLVDYFYCSSANGNVITIDSAFEGDTSKLKEGMIVVKEASSTFYTIDSVDDANTFTVDPSFSGSFSNDLILIYQDKGLVDNSKEIFCQGVFGRSAANTVPVGSTEIELDSVRGVETNQVVQFDGYIAANTSVVSVDVGNNTITIDNATIQEITQLSTIVFAPAGTTDNKEACVIPLDTSPPFNSTDAGLKTPISFPDIQSSSFSFDVSIQSLEFSANSEINNDLTYNKLFLINDGFGVLATKA